jgi:hypothetical protein
VQGKVTVDFVDAGEQDLKNIPRPVRATTGLADWASPSGNFMRAGNDRMLGIHSRHDAFTIGRVGPRADNGDIRGTNPQFEKNEVAN